MCTMTKSPVALAKEAIQAAQAGLDPYSSNFSRHDFTQQQLFAILVLRQFFKTDYRGIIQMLGSVKNLSHFLLSVCLWLMVSGRSSVSWPP